MKDILTYKDFLGRVHFSAEDKVFYGKIEGIDDLVTFEGCSVDELIKVFHKEVDNYISLCKEVCKEPLRSYKGSFNVRLSPDTHRKAVEKARMMGLSLNKFIQRIIEKEIIHKG